MRVSCGSWLTRRSPVLLSLALIHRLQVFLLELGHGSAFVGRQYHLEVNGNDDDAELTALAEQALPHDPT